VNAELTEFLTAGLRPVTCHACRTRVLVKKNSAQHTSIQWTSDAASSCPVFAAQAASGANTALLDTCGQLCDSIDYAVREGALKVADE
jgi:hypothetical protein